MQSRPLMVLAALAAATSPDFGKKDLARLKDGIRARFAEDPQGTVLATVIVGAYLFYKAEKGHNPKVTSYYDALVYVSTNLSVGYADIFAKTDAGKAIGTAIMTYGPAMSGQIFDAPAREAAAAKKAEKAEKADASNADVVARLDRILAVLERRAATTLQA